MSESTLSISVDSHKRVDVITANGRVDSSNAHLLDNALKASIEEGNTNIILDLSDVAYLSSAGLRAMVSALRECKKRSGDVAIATPSDRVVEVLDLAGLAPLFTTYDDLTTAVGSF